MDSLEILRENLETVRIWKPLTDKEKEELLAQAKPFAKDGLLEPHKIEL